VCAGGLGRFAADSSCFPTHLEKGGKERILANRAGREKRDLCSAKQVSDEETQNNASVKYPKKKGWAGGAQKYGDRARLRAREARDETRMKSTRRGRIDGKSMIRNIP
jgi:hypothetical protein